MFNGYFMKKIFIIYFAFLSLFFGSFNLSCYSLDAQGTAFSVSAETKDIDSVTETQKINELLDDLEKNWNNHDVDKVAKNYADNFVNGDGLDLEAIKSLTKELWGAYSDIKTKSQDRTVRVYGDYATVDSTDTYYGTSSEIRQEVGAKGVLKAVSVGDLFLRKFGHKWKITSDKTIFEKVSIGYGLGSDLVDKNKIKLSAPEQVASGQQYTASLDFDLPVDIKPVAAISKEMLIYPQQSSEDKFRLINEPALEKLISANKISKNELITATVGLTGGALNPKLLGLVFLTRRVNVVPVSEVTSEVSIIKRPAKSALTKEVDFLDIYKNEQKNENGQKDLKKQTDPNEELAPEDF